MERLAMFQPDEVYQGDARHIAEHIPADSEALSVWSSPYYVGKAYERDTSYIEWKAMLRRAIEAHTTVLKPDEFQHLFFFWKPGPTRIDKSRLTKDEWVAWESRAVWRIPSVCINDDHEAKFPLELPRRVIQLLTYPGELVIDCFAGSGTSGVAAVLERRCLLYTSPSPRDGLLSRMPSS